MYSEEEPELRDLIIQNLENCGLLKKIKAELRAGVILALEEDGNLRNKIPVFNEKFDDFVSTSEGKLMLSLVREFLEFFSLNFTLSVFDPEVASSSPCISRSELCDQLNLRTAEINGPIISALLQDVIGDRKQNSVGKPSNEFKRVPEKHISISNDTVTEKILDSTFIHENVNLKENAFIQNDLEIDCVSKSSKEDIKGSFNSTSTFLETNVRENAESKSVGNIFKEKSDEIEKETESDSFKESKDLLSPDHDPFFDEPVPSEKTSFFNFTETLKDKPESKLTSSNQRDTDDCKKSSLSSLRDLPSLTGNREWAFVKDSKSNLASLDLLKSFSNTETSNEEIANLGCKENFEKKDSDIAESNEESSEKQNSDESIEEEIEEDFSAGMDDLLNSSLSLGDDVTTDQTVSQVSVVDGVDHIEPCNS